MVDGQEKKKYKFLVVSNIGCGTNIAYQLKKEGNDVKMFIQESSESDLLEGVVEKVDDWEREKSWADIIIFDDTFFGFRQNELRQQGFKVIGGSYLGDRLELDRKFALEYFKKMNVKIPQTFEFNSFVSATKFLKDQTKRFIIKFQGKAGDEKSLLYLAQMPDNSDLIKIMDHYSKNWNTAWGEPEFVLQEIVEGVETAVTAFFNGEKFLMPVYMNFENKRFLTGDLGVMTGEQGTHGFFTFDKLKLFKNTLKKIEDDLKKDGYVGTIDVDCIINEEGTWPLEFTCFDEKTEILTKDGWKSYSDVKIGDCTLSINPETRELAWKKILNSSVMDYKGKMVKIGAKNKAHSAVDVLVTPEHKLLVSNSGHLKLVRADIVPDRAKLIRTGFWHCTSKEFVEIPDYTEKHFLGKYKKAMNIVHPSQKIKTGTFMKFLGLYLAEGSCTKYILSISQSPKGAKRKEMEKILDDSGFDYTVQKNGSYQINSVQLCRFIESLGLRNVKAGKKFVPSEFKEFAPEYLESLIYGFALGDGSWHKRTGQLYLATSSKRLSGDLQEIIVKCGKLSNIRVQKAGGTMSIGNYARKNDIYVLSMRDKKTDYYIDRRVVGEQFYEGKVWDVEVEDWHTLLVRRNGKPFFSGNCRFGYPLINLVFEAIRGKTRVTDLMAGLADKTLDFIEADDGYQIGVVICVPTYPYEEGYERYGKETPVIIMDKSAEDNFHLGDLKMMNGDWVTAGSVGYGFVVTGRGETMFEAKKQAYDSIKKIIVPNAIYRIDISDRWIRDYPRLHRWGFV